MIKGSKPKDCKLHIIELGCGTGWLAAVLSKYGDVIGVDLSVEAAMTLHPKIEFRQANVITDEIKGEYDIVVSTEVLEHLSPGDQKEYIKKAVHILNPGGHIILTTPNKRSDADKKRRLTSQQPVENWLDKTSVIALLQAHNLRMEFTGSCLLCPVLVKRFVLFRKPYEIAYDLLHALVLRWLDTTDKGLKLAVVARKREFC